MIGSIEDYLKSLGDTSLDVFTNLALQNIKGRKKSRSQCPIIKGIYAHCPNVWPGLESPMTGVLTFDDIQIIDPQCPTPIKQFMHEFDNGAYSILEEE